MESIENGYENPNEPIGIRILGAKDPTTLSISEFLKSPDLVHHGSATSFEFRDTFDYSDRDYTLQNDGSRTLGSALYTIPDRLEAAHYSVVRDARNNDEPKVADILPYQAHVLDLRCKQNPDKNGAFPKELISQWLIVVQLKAIEVAERERTRIQLKSALSSKLVAFTPMDTETDIWQEYASGLAAILTSAKDFTLRQVLGTERSEEQTSNGWTSPPWCNLWQQFMLSQQIDGVIYHEGGEKKGKGGTSYAFYNLNVIGTYEKWQERAVLQRQTSTYL